MQAPFLNFTPASSLSGPPQHAQRLRGQLLRSYAVRWLPHPARCTPLVRVSYTASSLQRWRAPTVSATGRWAHRPAQRAQQRCAVHRVALPAQFPLPCTCDPTHGVACRRLKTILGRHSQQPKAPNVAVTLGDWPNTAASGPTPCRPCAPQTPSESRRQKGHRWTAGLQPPDSSFVLNPRT